jgi:hypothetical protein
VLKEVTSLEERWVDPQSFARYLSIQEALGTRVVGIDESVAAVGTTVNVQWSILQVQLLELHRIKLPIFMVSLLSRSTTWLAQFFDC